jgi:predicted HD phosphohydrolase
MGSYIIRFDDERSRASFRDSVQRDLGLKKLDLHFAEFLPDVIASHLGARDVAELRKIAGNARFIEDFQHDPFSRERARI